MRFLLQLIFLLLQCQIFLIEGTAATTSQPYCYKNITETTYKTVTKTRIKNVRSRNFFKKMVSKKDTQIEIYEEQEPVYTIKVERVCCDGYKMNEYEACEPQCLSNGCPAHAKCVEPEVCECLKGYFSAHSQHDSKHHCQPICEYPCPPNSECVGPDQCACKKGYYHKSQMCAPQCLKGCPFGGTCIAPNKCACAEGYISSQGTCLASCSLGDQCQNGVCIAQDNCQCNNGFKWNNETFVCEEEEDMDTDTDTTTFNPEVGHYEHITKTWLEVETDIDNSNEDIDPNEVFDEAIGTTTDLAVTQDDDSTAKYTICPDDYIRVNGKCLPIKFASSDIDCWAHPCPFENAICLENGTCACQEGFLLFNSYSEEDAITLKQIVTSVCLTPSEYEAKIQEITQEATETTGWVSIFFIAFGIVIISCALILLLMKLLGRRGGEKSKEVKNLTCVYDNGIRFEDGKSVI